MDITGLTSCSKTAKFPLKMPSMYLNEKWYGPELSEF